MLVWNKVSRVLLLQLLYAAVLLGSFYMAFQLRFEFYPSPYMDRFRLGAALSLGITLPLLWLFGQFRSLLSYFGLPDAIRIGWATLIANLAIVGVWYGGWAEIAPDEAAGILGQLPWLYLAGGILFGVAIFNDCMDITSLHSAWRYLRRWWAACAVNRFRLSLRLFHFQPCCFSQQG